ncbi:MAG: discoidin domain-containing protein, partial [Clostridia bacterium]|nr:discoidin domain-containing protein [Clostridia bacterium]
SQGCTNVIRMDGGGSSGMYVKNKAGTGSAGYTQESQRAVADAILIVKKSSIPGLGESSVQPEGENVALNKTYTGAETSSAGSGSYSAKLTDGIVSAEMSLGSNWFGLYYNKGAASSAINAPNGVGNITVDLDEVVHGITNVRVHVWNNNSAGIMAAKNIKLLASKDGETYTEVGSLAIPDGTYPDWAYIKTDNISARYIRLAVETQGTWTFLNEIEVYADPNYVPDDDDPGTDNPGDDDPVVEPENIALGKDYETASPLNGYNAKLTDGVAAETMAYSGDKWFAFNGTNAPDKIGTVVIDLDGRYDINEVKINAIQNEGSGVGLPASVKVYLSDDGKTWGKATSLSIPNIANTTKDRAFTIEGAVTGTASYVKIEYTLGTYSFVFFNEIEVYGAANNDSSVGNLGDINASGSVDSLDYLLVKRACFKTYTLSEEETLRADINGDKVINSTDYLLVKRIAFGTYTVE